MFKKVLLCALSLSLLQCTAGVDEPGSSPTQVGHVTNPYERTAEQAVKVVRELLFKSEFRAVRAEREIAGVVDLSSVSELRSTQGMSEFRKTIKGSGLFGWGIFRKTRDGVRHLYHVNAGWDGASNGYFLYVQNVDNIFNYYGTTNAMDYRSNLSYLIVRPR